MSLTTQSLTSPFFSRAYGGFTSGQIEFYRKCLGRVGRKTIVDPMAGQGFALSELAYEGATLWLGDINPAPLVLASLRSREFCENRDALLDELESLLRKVKRKRRGKFSKRYVDAWVAPSIKSDLHDFADLLGIGLFANPFNDSFWQAPTTLRFCVAMTVLAARELACFRSTDNLTWLKPGGLQREHRIVDPMLRAASNWRSYAEGMCAEEDSNSENYGSLCVARMDVTRGDFGSCPKAHAVITSPPYANRLDYTKLWGPECEVLAAMCSTSVAPIRREQIGTTVMKDRMNGASDDCPLPQVAVTALEQIRSDGAAYSDNYYYPFFETYACSLVRGMLQIAQRLRKNGQLIVFVRDTVRKDILFPTGQLLVDALASQDVSLEEQQRRVISHHIGRLRRASTNGLYGLGQQEWWMSFRKGNK